MFSRLPALYLITNYCFYSINEANISDIIKTWNYYSNNYAVVNDYDYINISQLSEKYLDKLNLTNNEKYLIFIICRANLDTSSCFPIQNLKLVNNFTGICLETPWIFEKTPTDIYT